MADLSRYIRLYILFLMLLLDGVVSSQSQTSFQQDEKLGLKKVQQLFNHHIPTSDMIDNTPKSKNRNMGETSRSEKDLVTLVYYTPMRQWYFLEYVAFAIITFILPLLTGVCCCLGHMALSF